MYSSPTGSCATCVSPCKTCLSQVTCESCASGFYLFNQTQCTAACPNGYI